MGDILRLSIGLSKKGPAMRPKWTSSFSLASAAFAFCRTDGGLRASVSLRWPWKLSLNPLEKPSRKHVAALMSGYSSKNGNRAVTLIGVYAVQQRHWFPLLQETLALVGMGIDMGLLTARSDRSVLTFAIGFPVVG